MFYITNLTCSNSPSKALLQEKWFPQKALKLEMVLSCGSRLLVLLEEKVDDDLVKQTNINFRDQHVKCFKSIFLVNTQSHLSLQSNKASCCPLLVFTEG